MLILRWKVVSCSCSFCVGEDSPLRGLADTGRLHRDGELQQPSGIGLRFPEEAYYGLTLPCVRHSFPDREQRAIAAFYAELGKRLSGYDFRFHMHPDGILRCSQKTPLDFTTSGDNPAKACQTVRELFLELGLGDPPELKHWSRPTLDAVTELRQKHTQSAIRRLMSRFISQTRDIMADGGTSAEEPAGNRLDFFRREFAVQQEWFNDQWLCGYTIPAIVRWFEG